MKKLIVLPLLAMVLGGALLAGCAPQAGTQPSPNYDYLQFDNEHNRR